MHDSGDGVRLSLRTTLLETPPGGKGILKAARHARIMVGKLGVIMRVLKKHKHRHISKSMIWFGATSIQKKRGMEGDLKMNECIQNMKNLFQIF